MKTAWDIGAEIERYIAGGSFVMPGRPRLWWQPEYDIDEVLTPQIDIVPKSQSCRIISREAWETTTTVDVAVIGRIGAAGGQNVDSEVTDLVTFTASLVTWLAALRIDSGVLTEMEYSLFQPDELKEKRLFLSVITLTIIHSDTVGR